MDTKKMDIKREKFNQLPQLDRIEFRQRYIEISRRFSSKLTIFLIGLFFFWLLFGFCSASLFASLDYFYTSLWIILMTKKFSFLFYFSIFLSGIIDTYNYFRRRKILLNLEKEYKI